jgi:hypothetical protein
MHPKDLRVKEQNLEQQPRDAATKGFAASTPTAITPLTPELSRQIDAACSRIAPVWPLDRFVAVNPFHGLVGQHFEEAAATLRRIADARMYMPRRWYREQIEAGRISDDDLCQAARLCGSALTSRQLHEAAAAEHQAPAGGVPLLTALVDELDADDWSNFVVERISHHCAAYFDMGQATWKRPWDGMSLYASWRRFAALDYSLTMMGQDAMRSRVKALPESPRACIASALGRLGIPESAALDYMHAALMDIGGWAAWTRLQRWEQELAGGSDDSIVELLAIRLAWDVLLYEHKATPELMSHWREICARLGRGETNAGVGGNGNTDAEVEHVLLTALEQGYQRRLIDDLAAAAIPTHPRYGPRCRRLSASTCALKSSAGPSRPSVREARLLASPAFSACLLRTYRLARWSPGHICRCCCRRNTRSARRSMARTNRMPRRCLPPSVGAPGSPSPGRRSRWAPRPASRLWRRRES